MKLRCSNVENQEGMMSKSDPFFKLSKLREDGSYTYCYKSEVRMNNLNPAFQEIKGTIVQLANGDLFRPLRIEVFDWNRNGSHTLIGSFLLFFRCLHWALSPSLSSSLSLSLSSPFSRVITPALIYVSR